MDNAVITSGKWSLAKRVGIIFTAVFFFLMMAEFMIGFGVLPGFINKLLGPYSNFWVWFTKWTGKNILLIDYPITVMPNGSGDSTYNYVQLFVWVMFSFLFALTWVLLDRRHTSYRRLAYWLRIFIRYYLGYTLLVYGFVKVIKLQFPSPGLLRLLQPYGDSSPMGLAWTFVGFSTGYNMYIGGAEVLAGFLLFFKRTTLLGSLLSMTIMMNVAAMNFSFDIPVKIFSIILVLLSVYLAAFDWPRIRNVFFLNRTADAAVISMPQPTTWKRILQRTLKCLVILYALNSTLLSSLQNRMIYGDAAPKPPLYGIYNVNYVVVNHDTIPPLTTDTARWKQIIFNYKNNATVRVMSDSLHAMRLVLDTTLKTALFKDFRDTSIIYNFRYSQPDKEHLLFAGRYGNDSAFISTTRFDETRFRLMSRGFHWINEYPYNR
jgi:hypothetical protein